MSVAPRWKRRADEIAEAIGDELSINGTVSIGNDVSLSVATITALANAITNVLNPSSIAYSIWNDAVADLTATSVHVSSIAGYWSITNSSGTVVGNPNVITNSTGTGTLEGIDYAVGTVFTVNQFAVNSISNIWKVSGQQVRNVSVLSTNTTPVHVQVRNIAGGFTAMGSDISAAMKLTAQPVSIADTVNVKTDTGQSVDITGSVNLNVGTATVPVANPNNITVPVVNTNSVTVPVSLGSVTVPIKATTAGIPQNASGVSVYVPVDGNHTVTVPVSNTNSVSVPVSGGTSSVPISGGTSSVPVANTNNVTVPIATQTTSIDVNIKTIEVLAKTQFHEAMETALNDATDINVIDQTDGETGTIDISHNVANSTYLNLGGWDIRRSDGTTLSGQFVYDPIVHQWLIDSQHYDRIGLPVHKNNGFPPHGWSVTRLSVPDTMPVSIAGTVPVSIAGTVSVSGPATGAQVETAVTNALNNATGIDVSATDADPGGTLGGQGIVIEWLGNYLYEIRKDDGTFAVNVEVRHKGTRTNGNNWVGSKVMDGALGWVVMIVAST